MTLVDKLKVNRGDLILLDGGDINFNVVGYVVDYGAKKVKLSNTDLMTDDGKVRSTKWAYRPKSEKIVTLSLECFWEYEILKVNKYAESDMEEEE